MVNMDNSINLQRALRISITLIVVLILFLIYYFGYVAPYLEFKARARIEMGQAWYDYTLSLIQCISHGYAGYIHRIHEKTLSNLENITIKYYGQLAQGLDIQLEKVSSGLFEVYRFYYDKPISDKDSLSRDYMGSALWHNIRDKISDLVAHIHFFSEYNMADIERTLLDYIHAAEDWIWMAILYNRDSDEDLAQKEYQSELLLRKQSLVIADLLTS